MVSATGLIASPLPQPASSILGELGGPQRLLTVTTAHQVFLLIDRWVQLEVEPNSQPPSSSSQTIA